MDPQNNNYIIVWVLTAVQQGEGRGGGEEEEEDEEEESLSYSAL